jgi:hypothetical protein
LLEVNDSGLGGDFMPHARSFSLPAQDIGRQNQ